MSIKKRYETVTHEVTEKVLVEETMYCDICNKVIQDKEAYWEVTTGHHDWGNDSMDSIECFDVCSGTCLMHKFSEYIKKSGKNKWNTMYFDVRRETV